MLSVALSGLNLSSLERRGNFRHIASRPLFAASCNACGRAGLLVRRNALLFALGACLADDKRGPYEHGACAVQQRAGMTAAEFADMVLKGL